MSKRRLIVPAVLVAGLVALLVPFGAPAEAQSPDVPTALPAASPDNETTNLWFVELTGAPVADGNNLTAVRNEKAAFRRAAAAAGVRYTERRAFDVLFNGFSVVVNAADRMRLAQLPGVKAIYPVEIIQAPQPDPVGDGIAPDLAAAITMTGASIAQSQGYTGAGVKVGIIDTGIDIDHPDLGGNGAPDTTGFPGGRMVAGYDFVGNAFSGGNTPAPDLIPDDCNGHGTHVAGIVGANGTVVGVAPGVSFGAYRVFGCTGSTTADIMIAAMEMALADGMQVVNQSIGSARQWPQYPTAQAATRMVNKGVVMVASIGNNGPGGSAPDALFAAGAPGVGDKVIGVASYDNAQRAFTVGGTPYGYNQATGSPAPPTSGSLPMSKTGTTTTTNDACPPWQASFGGTPWAGGAWLTPGSLAGSAVLVRRGTCSFYAKAANAQQAGAAAVVLYNNAAGALNPTVAGTPPITIPVVAITAAQGATLNGLIAAGPTTLTWTGDYVSYPFGTGGLISSFSSFGLTPELGFKPNLGAPGGAIYSTYPLELGGYATLSGTSMSSPHVAGGVALILQARPNLPSNAMRGRLQNSADPKNWSGNAALGLLDHAFRQGAGMLDIVGTIQATTSISPSQIAVGESEAGPKTVTLMLSNEGSTAVTYDLGHSAGVATGPNTTAGPTTPSGSPFAISGFFNAPASVSFSAPSVAVPAHGSATVDVTITADVTLPDRGLYGGYITFTPQGGGAVYRVPYAGLKGDYQTTQILTPGINGFPWLAQVVGSAYYNRPTGATYTMVGTDIPYFLMHLDHQSRRIRLEAFDAVSGQAWNRVSDDEYVTRSSTMTSFFAFSWNGNTFTGKGKNANQWRTVPNGQYIVRVAVLKPLGDENNPAHWETWTSPVITIARP